MRFIALADDDVRTYDHSDYEAVFKYGMNQDTFNSLPRGEINQSCVLFYCDRSKRPTVITNEVLSRVLELYHGMFGEYPPCYYNGVKPDDTPRVRHDLKGVCAS